MDKCYERLNDAFANWNGGEPSLEDRVDALESEMLQKQDIIPDLAAIRSGAAAGATAVQQTEFETDKQRQDALEAEDRAALVDQVDGGAKNGFNILATPTVFHASYTISGNTISAVATDYYARVSFPCAFKSGKNIFKCIVSNLVVVGGNMQIRFSRNADSSGSISVPVTIAQNGDVYSEISVSAGTNGYIIFYLNPSNTSYENSADFSEIMLCSAAEYAISPVVVPYAPTNRELYEMILALQNGS